MQSAINETSAYITPGLLGEPEKPMFLRGDRIEVKFGPFAGEYGTVAAGGTNVRLRVTIGTVFVSLPIEWLAKA